tara:strand:+ start:1611 stop:4298 length:2688 start_codon:yes stop_codon:yes gene_type:complete
MNAFQNFLDSHKYDKDKHSVITHTRIGNKDNNIFGGSYHIQDEHLQTFYKLYYDKVFVKNIPEYFTEKQNTTADMLYVDLDFNYAELGRYHTEEVIEIIIGSYFKSIQTYLNIFNEPINVSVFERELPYFNGSKNKDGLHIIFGINVDRKIQMAIRNDVMNSIDLSMLPLINSIEDVFDETITKGTTNLQLFGSQKPNCEPYKIKYLCECMLDSADNELSIKQMDTNMSIELFKNIVANGNTSLLDPFQTNLGLELLKIIPTKPTIVYSQTNEIQSIDILKKLSQCWIPSRIDSSETWFKLGWGIANVFGKSNEVCDIFINLNDSVPSRSSNTEKQKAREWFIEKCEIRKDNTINIGSLIKFAKDDNRELYDTLFPKTFDPLIEFFEKDYSTGRMAEYFSKEYKDHFICVDSMVYHYNGVYWKKDSNRLLLHKFIDDIVYNKISKWLEDSLKSVEIEIKSLPEDSPKLKILEFNKKKLHKNIKTIETQIRNHSGRKQLIEDIIIHINKICELDKNPYLFAFENKVFDLKTNTFVKSNPEDYLTLSCGYDYIEDSDIDLKKKTLFDILATIFPDKSVMDFYLESLSTGLFGQQVEHLFIATGEGGNGKSLINSIMMTTVGTYGYKLPSSALLSEIKQGANPQLSNLHKKRYVVVQEPDANKRINSSTMKEITGDRTLNVRDIYTSNCMTELMLSLFLEANTLPLLTEINDAIIRRIRTIPFISSFVDKNTFDEMSDTTNVFVGNSSYKSVEFQTSHRQAFFLILADYFKSYMKNGNAISPMPSACIESGKKYYMLSDDLYQWFSDSYEVCPKSFVYINEVFDNFKYSSAFNNMTKNDKRKNTKSNFEEKIQKNMFLRTSYRARDAYFGKERIKKAFIIGYRRVAEYEEPSAIGYSM